MARRTRGRWTRWRGLPRAATWPAALLAALATLAACPTPPSPGERLAAGRHLFAANCLHCHREIRLEGRVRGWDEARAYDTVGRLWQVSRAMPRFEFGDEERRSLAAFLAAVGRGEEKVER